MSTKVEFNQLLADADIDTDRLYEALHQAGYRTHRSTVGRYIDREDPERAKEPPPWMLAVARKLVSGPKPTFKPVQPDDASRVYSVSVPKELVPRLEKALTTEGHSSRSAFLLTLLRLGLAEHEKSMPPPIEESVEPTIPRYRCAVCGQPASRRKGDGDQFLPSRHMKANGKPCPGNFRYAQLMDEKTPG